MNTRISSLIKITVFLMFAVAGHAAHSATIKCWTNNEGIKECGTVVPPEYAQQGHEEINKHGMVINEQERAKTDEEIEEAKRLADIERQKKEKEAEMVRRDQILLDVYTKVEDIEQARDDNLKVIQSRITLTESRIEKTQEDLDKRIQSAAAAERSGNKPNEDLMRDIDILQKRLSTYQEFIAEREAEMETVRLRFDQDIERFKELKGI